MKKYNKQKSFGFDSDGKRIRKWFHADSLPELEKQIDAYKLQLTFTPNADNTTFKKYSEQWLTVYKGGQSKGTQYMYRSVLKHTEKIDPLPVAKITKTKCQEVIKGVWEKPRTAQILALTLKQIFSAAVSDGMILRNPASNLDLPKRPKSKFYLIDDKILNAIPKADLSPNDAMLVQILRTFGLRPAEALALTVDDFDFDTMTLHINKALELSNDNVTTVKSTKTGVSRDIPIPSSMVSNLKSYFADLSGVNLFVNKDNGLLTKTQYECLCVRIIKAINIACGGDDKNNVIPGFTLYAFRHYRASELLYLTKDGKLSILMASRLMGHSVNVFLNTYAHVLEEKEDLSRIYDNL